MNQEALNKTHFIDPDGDLLPRGEVQSIIIQRTGFFFIRHEVLLRYKFSSGTDYIFSRKTRKKAKKVRDALIATFFPDTSTIEKTIQP